MKKFTHGTESLLFACLLFNLQNFQFVNGSGNNILKTIFRLEASLLILKVTGLNYEIYETISSSS